MVRVTRQAGRRRERSCDDRGDGRALLGCFVGLAALLLLTAGIGALPFILSAFFWKFVLPVLIFVGLGALFFFVVLSGDDDEGAS